MSWSTDNPRGDRNARRITQPDPGGSGGDLPAFIVLQFNPWGFPTDGTVDMTFTIPDLDDEEDPGVEKEGTITLPWDCTKEQFKEQFLTHPSIHDDKDFLVLDGAWPKNGIWLQFRKRLKNKSIAPPEINTDLLTGGIFPVVTTTRFWVSS
ncbi:hypothetical protein SH661x_000434 [Planctomicrobium sp. SH661]|uniref:hypothetical protein n=1 Tax=Planctomicrobium sp. SH661 TaxID=3448124 RepID=UPI003F5C8D47